MIRNDEKAVVFETLVNNEREKAIGWLRNKYDRFSSAECEDIFQEACVELWKKFVSMTEWAGEPMTGMLYRICRNLATHHLDKLPYLVDWEDTYYPEDNAVETDFGYVTPDVYRMMQKEWLYHEIEKLQPKDRDLMLMHLRQVKMKEICKDLGFASSQVVKNRKGMIVKRLRKEISGQVNSTCPLFLWPYVGKWLLYYIKMCHVGGIPIPPTSPWLLLYRRRSHGHACWKH